MLVCAAVLLLLTFAFAGTLAAQVRAVISNGMSELGSRLGDLAMCASRLAC